MKRILMSTVAVVALLATSQAFAQTATITIAPEQRTMMKQYVVKERVKAVPMREKVVIGATIPADVELQAVPQDWGPSVVRYRYIYSDDRVVFVDPSSRKVIHLVD